MDSSYTHMPPVSGPKLPEPPLLKPEPRPLGKREGVLIATAGALILALAAWFALFALGSARTPAQAVGRFAGEAYALEEELVQLSLPGDGQRSVLFYISGGQLACALLQRKASGYRLLDASGFLPLSGAGKQGAWQLSGLQGAEKEYLVFGLLYDAALTAVAVNGSPAVVVSVGKYRCWYYFGQGGLSVGSESIIYK
jgi:hypothetical protein